MPVIVCTPYTNTSPPPFNGLVQQEGSAPALTYSMDKIVEDTSVIQEGATPQLTYSINDGP